MGSHSALGLWQGLHGAVHGQRSTLATPSPPQKGLKMCAPSCTRAACSSFPFPPQLNAGFDCALAVQGVLKVYNPELES